MNKKVAIITGAAGGIGKASARRLLDDSIVVGFDINDEELNDSAKELNKLGTFIPKKVDITNEDEIASTINAVSTEIGPVQLLINNAGGSFSISQDIDLISFDEWCKVINVNLHATFLCMKYTIPFMKELKWGRIINMSSVAGRSRSYFGGTPYAASKAGIIGLTRHSSRELGPHHITVNAIAPGTILSGERIESYWQEKKTEEKEKLIESIPLGRLGNSEEVAGVVKFLCSDDASYITGAVLDVNGGMWVG